MTYTGQSEEEQMLAVGDRVFPSYLRSLKRKKTEKKMIEEMKIYSALKGRIEGPKSFKSNRSNYRLGSIGLEGNEYETQLVGLLRET